MMRPSVQGVGPPVCCVLDVTVTYARDSFVDSHAGPFVLSRGGPGILDVTVTYARDSFVDSQGGLLSSRGGGGPDTLAPVLQLLGCAYTINGAIFKYCC